MINKTKWSIDHAHSEIAFKVKHLMIAYVKGSFKTFNASTYTNEKDFSTAEMDVLIDVSSITTNDTTRDEHLKSEDFFDVKNHKQITFIANTIGKSDANGISELWGELTIKGITKKIKLVSKFGGIITDNLGNEKAGFHVTGKTNRNDWGFIWNTSLENGGIMIGEEIIISCDIELINESQKELEMELEHLSHTTAAL